MGNSPSATVLIRAKDEEAFLGDVLDALEGQTVRDFDVVLVDSGSRDRTLAIARRFERVRIVRIPPERFTFGMALNAGIREARGPVIVNLSAHAVPTAPTYLEAIVAGFADPAVAGVVGGLEAGGYVGNASR